MSELFPTSQIFFPVAETNFKDCPLSKLAKEIPNDFCVSDLDKPIAKQSNSVEKFANVVGNSESKEGNEGFFSLYKERLDQTPLDGPRGHWEGERGWSKFVPTNEEIKSILAKHGLDGIDYKNGVPDFSGCSECTVEIENMSPQRRGKGGNFEQCDAKCAELWNREGRDGRSDWTARDVEQWRTENKYTWHERNDRKTCDLVPTEINDYFGHLGGVSECMKALNRDMEDEFDD